MINSIFQFFFYRVTWGRICKSYCCRLGQQRATWHCLRQRSCCWTIHPWEFRAFAREGTVGSQIKTIIVFEVTELELLFPRTSAKAASAGGVDRKILENSMVVKESLDVVDVNEVTNRIRSSNLGDFEEFAAKEPSEVGWRLKRSSLWQAACLNNLEESSRKIYWYRVRNSYSKCS